MRKRKQGNESDEAIDRVYHDEWIAMRRRTTVTMWSPWEASRRMTLYEQEWQHHKQRQREVDAEDEALNRITWERSWASHNE